MSTNPSGTSRNAPPRAGAMIEALRGLGYSAPTAIADILDNSISAGASAVDLTFGWNGSDSHLVIADNGRGMSAVELDLAMRLGERNPLDQREVADLGRFGLGLKTASFSQCRRLTVASRQDGATSILRWDLDLLAASTSGEWSLYEGAAPGSEPLLRVLDEEPCGTVVLWEVMDRIAPKGCKEQDFLNLIDRVEEHLAMVFHRFIESRAITIRINGRPISPWDPFLENHPATWRSREDHFTVDGDPISVRGFVLPHRDRVDPKVWERAAGPDGWTSQQGFYVYRTRRLLLAGSWLGLGRGRGWAKDEAFKLARIRIDLPNSADAEWKIDIRKSVARPPPEVRERLTLFAEDVRERARRVFAHRGTSRKAGKAAPLVQAWAVDHTAAGVRYRVDQSHPAVASVLEQAGDLAPELKAMIRIIEETVPIQQIWLETAEARESPRTGFADAPPAEVRALLQTLFRNLVERKGLSPERAREQLANTEPFDAYPEHVAELELGQQE